MTIYDTIGNNYNESRRADDRIVDHILQLLRCPASSLVADIGAGTGNYSYELAQHGYLVHALEPSEKMRQQRKLHKDLTWHAGCAEAIPFQDGHYDGVISTMATHHFSSLDTAFREMHRILKSKGRLVVFTADLRRTDENSWLKEYFKPHFELAHEIHPECKRFVELAESIFSAPASVTPFPLPHDLKDGFFYSAWRYPEKYLDSSFTNSISCFRLLDKKDADGTLKKLEHDLKSGAWDKKFGHVRNSKIYNGGCYFLSIEK